MATQIDTSRMVAFGTFGLLPQPTGRIRSFMQSVVLNVSLAALFLFLTITQAHNISAPRYVSTELVFPIHIPPPSPRHRIPTLRRIVQLPARLEIPTPKPVPQQPEIARLNTPPLPVIAVAPARVVAAPQPKLGTFAAPAPELARKSSVPSVKAGGFGNPVGVVPNPNTTKPASAIAAVGSFENAPGAGKGPGDGTDGTTRGRGKVNTGAFGVNRPARNVAAEVKPLQDHPTPPKILSEPRPQYTAEARQLRIQGEVTLQVRFGVDGKVEVLRVVAGLGHGLDEEATRVARQIQFKPAEKNGQPADHVTYIHILFQLA